MTTFFEIIQTATGVVLDVQPGGTWEDAWEAHCKVAECIGDDPDDGLRFRRIEVEQWIVPPECRGQMIEYAYGQDDDGTPWERRTDRSARETTYRALPQELADDDWAPWNAGWVSRVEAD